MNLGFHNRGESINIPETIGRMVTRVKNLESDKDMKSIDEEINYPAIPCSEAFSSMNFNVTNEKVILSIRDG